MTFELKVIEDIDNELFNIPPHRKYMPPAAVQIAGRYYRIAGFQDAGDTFIYYGEYGAEEAVNIAAGFMDDKSIITLARIAFICDKLGAEKEKISVFAENSIKGRKTFETLANILKLPKNILEYAAKKNVPVKMMSLILAQKDNVISFLDGFLARTEPSLQNFRVFLEQAADFKEIIPHEYSPDFLFPDRMSLSRRAVEDAFANFASSLKDMRVSNNDCFESPKITVSFDIHSAGEFREHALRLSENIENAEIFYRVLKDNDIC